MPTLNFLQLMHESKDPTIYETLAENAAAVLGLVFATLGVIGSTWLGWPHADAIASLAIGALLVAVAAYLASETRSLLTGETASEPVLAEIRRVFELEDFGAELDPELRRQEEEVRAKSGMAAKKS